MSAMYSPLYAASGHSASPGLRPRARSCVEVGEVADLHARVVVVELAMHVVALRFEQVRERVAERGLTAVADVQRTGRIRRHELDEHALARIARRAAVSCAFAQHGRDHVLLRRRCKTQIDEAGTRHFRALDETFRGRKAEHRIDDLLRELARIRAQRLGELHRDIRCHVAVRRDLRPFEDDRGRDEGRFGGALRGLRDLLDRVGEERFESVFVCGQHAECDPVERVRSGTAIGPGVVRRLGRGDFATPLGPGTVSVRGPQRIAGYHIKWGF